MKKLLLRIMFNKNERELLKFIFERDYGSLGMQNYPKELEGFRNLFNCEFQKIKEQSTNQK